MRVQQFLWHQAPPWVPPQLCGTRERPGFHHLFRTRAADCVTIWLYLGPTSSTEACVAALWVHQASTTSLDCSRFSQRQGLLAAARQHLERQGSTACLSGCPLKYLNLLTLYEESPTFSHSQSSESSGESSAVVSSLGPPVSTSLGLILVCQVF